MRVVVRETIERSHLTINRSWSLSSADNENAADGSFRNEVSVDKICDVIGTDGMVIRGLLEDTGTDAQRMTHLCATMQVGTGLAT